jgi:hypothetical protein
MPWIRTTQCADIPDSDSYCICNDSAIDLTPGTPGDTQTFDCMPCGDFGLQPAENYCCNLSGTVSE